MLRFDRNALLALYNDIVSLLFLIYTFLQIYQQHKVLSAATKNRDLLISRCHKQTPDGFFCFATSVESDKVPLNKEYGRAKLVFSGCNIKELSKARCEVTLISCFDFNGWIHWKFIDKEKEYCALRLMRLKKLVLEKFKEGSTTSSFQPSSSGMRCLILA